MRLRFAEPPDQHPAVLFDHANRGRRVRLRRQEHEGQAEAAHLLPQQRERARRHAAPARPGDNAVADVAQHVGRQLRRAGAEAEPDCAEHRRAVPHPAAEARQPLGERAVGQADRPGARREIVERRDERALVARDGRDFCGAGPFRLEVVGREAARQRVAVAREVLARRPDARDQRHMRTGMSAFSSTWRVTPPRISCRSREWL